MDTAITCWMALSMLALFCGPYAEKRLGKMAARWPITTWHFAFRSLWGGSAWLLLTIFSGVALHKLFPNEPVYLASGSWITVGPAILWGTVTVWIVTGNQEVKEGDAPTATMEGRIDASVAFLATFTGRALRYAAWTIGAALALLAVYLLSTWLNSSLAEMPRNSAIILDAVIIAWAVAARR